MNECNCDFCLKYVDKKIKFVYNTSCVYFKFDYENNITSCKINKLKENRYCYEENKKCIHFIDVYNENIFKKIIRIFKEWNENRKN